MTIRELSEHEIEVVAGGRTPRKLRLIGHGAKKAAKALAHAYRKHHEHKARKNV